MLTLGDSLHDLRCFFSRHFLFEIFVVLKSDSLILIQKFLLLSQCLDCCDALVEQLLCSRWTDSPYADEEIDCDVLRRA